MKKIKIKDRMFIVMIVLFVLFAFSTLIGVKHCIESSKVRKDLENEMIQGCEILDRSTATKEHLEICDRMLADDYENYKPTAYTSYYSYILEYIRKYCNEFILILIILIGSVFYATKYLRNRIILNDLSREDYKHVKKKLFCSSWKYSLLVPFMLVIVFSIVILFVGSVAIMENERSGYLLENTIFANNVLVYFGVLLLNAFILTLLYCNIGLIVARKEHNYILAVIKSYIIIIGIEIFFEVILYHIIYKLSGSSFGVYFNIITVFEYTYTEKNLLTIWILLGLLVISFVVLYLSYRNKEHLIIDCEKNDNKEED